jgi:phosphoserine phosphatase
MPEQDFGGKPAIVFDLDGTILSINSFRLWVSQMIAGHFPGMSPWRRAVLSLGAIRALAKRKAGMSCHETLKWTLQRHWQKATRGDGGVGEREFVQRLCFYVRPDLIAVLGAVAEGKFDAVMATAAAADYAEAFGRLLGFNHILSTPRVREEGSPSTVGARKRDAVLSHLASLGWQNRPIIFFTDHAEDLPLILRSHTVYWFGSEEERRVLAGRITGVTILPGRRGSEILAKIGMGTGSRC